MSESKCLNTFVKRALQTIVITCGVWFSSEWWEKGLASPSGEPVISPDGCTRLQAFKPFWLLPDIFHVEYPPNDDGKARWFSFWEAPGFFRLYNHQSGELIGETVIYDLEFSGGPLRWYQSGEVWVGMTYLGKRVENCSSVKSEHK